MGINFRSTGLSFTSNIKFIPDEEFENKHDLNSDRALMNDKYYCSTQSHKNFVLEKKAYTQNIQCCISGGLTNLKKVFMWHLHPGKTVNNLDEMRENIDVGYKKLSSEGNEIRGLISGGYPNNLDSKNVFLELMKKLGSLNTNLVNNISVLRNNNGMMHDLSYSSEDDTWLIGVWDMYRYGKTKEAVSETIKEEFSDIYICNEDKVFFGDEQVDKKLLNSKKDWWKS